MHPLFLLKEETVSKLVLTDLMSEASNCHRCRPG